MFKDKFAGPRFPLRLILKSEFDLHPCRLVAMHKMGSIGAMLFDTAAKICCLANIDHIVSGIENEIDNRSRDESSGERIGERRLQRKAFGRP